MNDSEIIRLYFERKESAITETKNSYGDYLKKITFNILGNHSDCEECINDTFLCIWNKIPPAIPQNFAAFIAKIAREKAIDIYRKKNTQKRQSNFSASLDELSECIPDNSSIEKQIDSAALGKEISDFLRTQPRLNRNIFIQRYFYCHSLSEIAESQKISISSLKSKLNRMRKALKKHLEKESFEL